MEMEVQHPESKIMLQNISVLNSDNMEAIIDQMAGHMRFYATFQIIYGALACLSIFGAIIGIPSIIYHYKLRQSAEDFRSFSRSKDFFTLNQAFQKQKEFFYFNKILIIILIVLVVLGILTVVLINALLHSAAKGSFA